ncbi:MAG: LicD family protein [Streptococcus sp.]|nr:LicD family protein [Streptococcus sp.]
MKELTLEEIQKVSLRLLRSFDEICQKENFRYSLGGGTLLGAIRHEGFIPWDDDIDLMMPRPDYEKFLKYCNDNPIEFDVFSLQSKDNYYELFAKLCNKDTAGENKDSVTGSNMGVGIDIFPIDGLGNSYDEAIFNFNKTKFKRELMIAAKWTHFTRSKTRSIIFEPIRLAFYIMSRFVDKERLSKKIDEECQQIKFSDSEYSACISGVYREKEIMPTLTFKNYIKLKFEGTDFSVISQYDDYLKLHYGDYMILPPKEKQVSHHSTKFFWK